MNSNAHDCCDCGGKIREDRHDFMARVGNGIVVIKDVPAPICDTCGEVEYMLEISREVDVIMKDFFAGRLPAKPLAAGENGIQAPAGRLDGVSIACLRTRAKGQFAEEITTGFKPGVYGIPPQRHRARRGGDSKRGFETDARHRRLLNAEKLVRSGR